MPFTWEAVSGFGIIVALSSVIWGMLLSRIRSLEKTVDKNKETFNGKTPLIYASAARLDDMEKSIDKMEASFAQWLRRIEDKIDGLRNRG